MRREEVDTLPSSKHSSIIKRLLLSLLLLLCLSIPPLSQADQFKSVGTTDVYFSPNGGAAESIVKEINTAKQEILVQAYSFTSKPIVKAHLNAHKRGLKIEVMLDKSQRKHKYA